jgi:hypothetical protein
MHACKPYTTVLAAKNNRQCSSVILITSQSLASRLFNCLTHHGKRNMLGMQKCPRCDVELRLCQQCYRNNEELAALQQRDDTAAEDGKSKKNRLQSAVAKSMERNTRAGR